MLNKIRLLPLFLFILSLLFPVMLRAEEAAIVGGMSPDALVKNVSTEVLAIIRQDKDIQSGNQRKVINLVERKVLPHFNFARMTALALGRDWRQASSTQKKALTDAFQTLLVRTYSNALTAYKDQKLAYRPFRMRSEDTDVIVRTEIIQTTGSPIPIDYSLHKQEGQGGWKVYDVTIGGVSLVTNYRTFFASEVKNGGIDGLIKTLQSKNHQ